MTQWEYLMEEVRLSDKWSSRAQQQEYEKFRAAFTQRGLEGWELVSYSAIPVTGSIQTQNIKSYAYMAIFKRPIARLPQAPPLPPQR